MTQLFPFAGGAHGVREWCAYVFPEYPTMIRAASLAALATLAPAASIPVALLAPTAARAASITYEASFIAAMTSDDGVSGFTTDGADMTGMTVTGTFAGGATETLTFAPTAGNAGGATGSLFSVLQTDTTYSNPFQISNLSGLALERLSFDAGAGQALFDRTFGSAAGTTGSSSGKDLQESGTALTGAIVVTFSAAVGVAGADPVGDLFARMTVDLTGVAGGGLGAGQSWAFIQDTDTLATFGDLTPAVPVPAAGGLLAAGLAALAAVRRRRA